jgi:hypothetical protein
MSKTPDGQSPQEQLGELFGSYKAEWLSEQVFDLFTEPAYWPELTTNRPCVLVGGRGTGKTTVLRSLSYEGQYALGGKSPDALDGLRFFGFYERVDTNRVRAFEGQELAEPDWVRIFAHYLNLSMCASILKFCAWYVAEADSADLLDRSTCGMVAKSMNLAPAGSPASLSAAIHDGLIALGAQVNNVGAITPTGLSMQKQPVDLLMAKVSEAFPGKPFFFLFDEYENFNLYQQRIVNTMIKHSGPDYTFKVGVREFGFKTRATLNLEEKLTSPADYVLISIDEKLKAGAFSQFAAKVCDGRLRRIRTPDDAEARTIRQLLPGLSEEEEAVKLGVEEVLSDPTAKLAQELSSGEMAEYLDAPLLNQYLVARWAAGKSLPLVEVARDYLDDKNAWRNRLNNYGYGLLFTIKRGRGKGGVQKYYCGWEVMTVLAAGNIRYLLELVEACLRAHLDADRAFGEVVDPVLQTRAAQAVGRKNLAELEGVSVDGARLTKLVLGLGRVFQVLALDPIGHAPEVIEFELGAEGQDPSGGVAPEVDELLKLAVSHLALLRRPGTKLSSATNDTRDFDYRLHPVFSAFFEFSHRQKRKLTLFEGEIEGLISRPSETIPRILGRHGRSIDEPLPTQLGIFEGYFAGST